MALKAKDLYEPTLLIDLKRVERNIDTMCAKALANNVALQPHFKTHQSIKIGELFRAKGVDRITVSSLKMAEYFAQNNWANIHIAMPPISPQRKALAILSQSTNLSLNISSVAHLAAIDNLNQLQLYIDIDPGYGRTGIGIDNTDKIEQLISEIDKSEHKFSGFYLHNGATYLGWQEVLDLHADVLKGIKQLKKHLNFNGNVLFGDTPSCSMANNFKGISHLTAGNFVFYDLMQNHLGSCLESQIAVCMACPIIEKRNENKQFVIHGGAVHFSKDTMIGNTGATIYGKMVVLKEDGWSDSIKGCELISLSQEHGKLQVTDAVFNQYNVGDVVGILPVHSCLTSACMQQFVSFDGVEINMM